MRTTIDGTESERYRMELEEYLTRVVTRDGSFCCSSAPRCRGSVRAGHSLAEGQLSYVGDGYVARVGEHEQRILVVSMQVGDTEAPVSMKRRSEQIRTRVPQLPKVRNAHMRGVTYALQILHGLDVGPDTERLDDGTHVLDAYAMVNSTLCSNLPTGGLSRRGGPTPTMLQRCGDHLRQTVEILRPTVIHSQGRTKAGSSTHSAVEAILDSSTAVDDWNSIVRVGDVEAVWCSLPHPSSGPPQAWQWPTNQFFTQVVEPSLRDARALSLAASTEREPIAEVP